MPEREPFIGSIETGFDGEYWYNRVVGSYTLVIARDSAQEAERKGRVMAEMRRTEHLVRDAQGDVTRRTRYGR